MLWSWAMVPRGDPPMGRERTEAIFIRLTAAEIDRLAVLVGKCDAPTSDVGRELMRRGLIQTLTATDKPLSKKYVRSFTFDGLLQVASEYLSAHMDANGLADPDLQVSGGWRLEPIPEGNEFYEPGAWAILHRREMFGPDAQAVFMEGDA